MGRTGDNTVCVTVLGRDRPGIIAGITRVLYERAANIRESAMTILGHQCALLVITQLPRNMSITEMERALDEVKRQYDLSVFVTRVASHDLSPDDIGPARSWSVTLYGGDHPGIVHEVAQLMASFDATITELKVRIVGHDPDIGIISLRVRPPRDLSMERVRPELEKLGPRFGLEVRFS